MRHASRPSVRTAAPALRRTIHTAPHVEHLEARALLSASFQGLGHLQAPFLQSVAAALSADGSTVVGRISRSVQGRQVENVFRWTRETGMVDLGLGLISGPSAVSADGSVVVWQSEGADGYPRDGVVRWTPTATTTIDAWKPIGVSADGSTVVGTNGSTLRNPYLFRWSEETGLIEFPDSPYFGRGGGVADDASFVAGSALGGAVRWSESGGAQPLGFPFANDISGDGKVVVGGDHSYSDRVIRWTEETGPVDVGILPGVGSSALATNRDGSTIVGYYLFSGSRSTAFVWTPSTGMQSIHALLEAQGVDLDGWRLSSPVGVSDDGRVITGQGLNPEGVNEAWIATLDPSAPAKVLDRHVFYNESSFDGNDAAAGAADDGAVATDKNPLLTGQDRLPGFDNVTSYGKGVNGVMIDIAGLPRGQTLATDDFDFGTVGAPTSVTVRAGAGIDGSDRVTLVWRDYNPQDASPLPQAVGNGWLTVMVKANTHTGLATPDVFSFGNLIGETGDGIGATGWRVSALDLGAVKKALNMAANITSTTDVNRDGRVNALDLGVLKRNLNHALPPSGMPTMVQGQPMPLPAPTASVSNGTRRVADEILA